MDWCKIDVSVNNYKTEHLLRLFISASKATAPIEWPYDSQSRYKAGTLLGVRIKLLWVRSQTCG